MAEITEPGVDGSGARDRRHALLLLHVFCLLSVLAGTALLVAALAAMAAGDSSTARMLRIAILHPGMTILALMLGGAALAAARLRQHLGSRILERLRERLYFVATVAALVLMPSAFLGWHWAAEAKPVAGIGVSYAMEAIAHLIVLLLLVRNARDALRLRPGAR